MEVNIFIYLAVIFGAAYATKVAVNKIKIPEVTGFVLLGVILGVSVVKLLTPEMLTKFSPISTIALGMIAFTIGIELKVDVIKSLGKSIFSIVACESLGAFVVVFVVLRFIYQAELNTALLLGLIGIAEYIGVSELLAAMAFGAVIVNTSPVLSKKSANIVTGLSPIFITAFFILGGANLDISLIKKIGVLGLWYFAARSIGKTGGASLGAHIGKAPKTVRSLVGFALLPQVGVALALALAINKEFTLPQYGSAGATMATIVINVLLFTTIITEIIGPLLTRYALKKAGEVHVSDKD